MIANQAAEEGGMVALSHLPTVLGVEQKYFDGGLGEHWIATYGFMDDVLPTSNEKKAPPSMDRLQKGKEWQMLSNK